MHKREYLLQQLDDRVASFKSDSEKHKMLYRALRYSVFIFTAISTLLAGFAITFSEFSLYMNLTIVFVSASIGVITSIEGIRKPAELWIHERSTYYALLDLKREAEFKLDESSSAEMIEELFFRMQKILEASGEKWSKKISNSNDKKEKDVEQA
jgi:hypothetical protein